MNPALSEAVLNAVREAGESPHQLQENFRAVQLGGPRGAARKVSFLLFNPGMPSPSLVVKASRDAMSQASLKAELAVLRDLEPIPELRGKVPRPVTCFESGGEIFTVETCVPGVSLGTLLRRRRRISHRAVSRDIARILDWLHDFQACTVSRESFIGSDDLSRDLEGCLSEGKLPAALDSRLRPVCRSLEGCRISRVGRHGDPWPGNVFLDGSLTGMLDWDGFSTEESPFDDVLHALITYAQTYPWRGSRWVDKAEAFRLSFLSDNWWSRILFHRLAQYLLSMGLSWEAGELFLALFLARRASEQPDNTKSFWPRLLEIYCREHAASVFLQPDMRRAACGKGAGAL